ncbi:DUF2550 domain-containing protein [soil metagenome]
MPVWLWIADSLALIIGLLLAFIVILTIRRRFIARGGPTFDLSINVRDEAEARGWALGVGRYAESHLEWFRVFSLSPRPRYRFERGQIEVDGRRIPEGKEAFALHAGHVIVAAETYSPVRQLAMSPDALTGMLSWLESSPPGQRSNNVV